MSEHVFGQPDGVAPTPQTGYNSTVDIEGNLIHKTTVHRFTSPMAEHMAQELERYVAAFDDEPLDVPAVKEMTMIPDSGLFRIRYTSQLCTGANLCELKGEELQTATAAVLGVIASMSTLPDDRTRLIVPIDATAQNFHYDEGQPVLVDVFPPLARRPDGSFPMQNLQYPSSWIRQRYVPDMRETQAGTILRTLATALTGGDKPIRQLLQAFRPVDEWCYDVIPADLSADTKAIIRREMNQRFVGLAARVDMVGAVCLARSALRIEPYADQP